jgi:Ca2+-binding EF-hand superfamily protein
MRVGSKVDSAVTGSGDSLDPLAKAPTVADAAADFADAAAFIAVVAAAEAVQTATEAMCVVTEAIAVAVRKEKEAARRQAEKEQARRQQEEELEAEAARRQQEEELEAEAARRQQEEELEAEAEARRHAEEERQRQAEEQARWQAEQDEQARRRQAEEEEKWRAEEEKRKQVKEAARRQAEKEEKARWQAEEDASVQVAEEVAERQAIEHAQRQAEEARAKRRAEEEATRKRAAAATVSAVGNAAAVAFSAATGAAGAADEADGWSAGAARSALIGFGGLRTSPTTAAGESETSNARAAARAVRATRAKAKTVGARKQNSGTSIGETDVHVGKSTSERLYSMNIGCTSERLVAPAEGKTDLEETRQHPQLRRSESKGMIEDSPSPRRKRSDWDLSPPHSDDEITARAAGLKRSPSSSYGAMPESPVDADRENHGTEGDRLHLQLEGLTGRLAGGAIDASNRDGGDNSKQWRDASSMTQIVQSLLVAYEKTQDELRTTKKELQQLRDEVIDGGSVAEGSAVVRYLHEAVKTLREEAKAEKIKVCARAHVPFYSRSALPFSFAFSCAQTAELQQELHALSERQQHLEEMFDGSQPKQVAAAAEEIASMGERAAEETPKKKAQKVQAQKESQQQRATPPNATSTTHVQTSADHAWKQEGALKKFTDAMSRNKYRMRSVDLFRGLDLDRSGNVSREELQVGLTRIGLGLWADGEIGRLLDAFDTDGDGEISFMELKEGLEKFEEEQKKMELHENVEGAQPMKQGRHTVEHQRGRQPKKAGGLLLKKVQGGPTVHEGREGRGPEKREGPAASPEKRVSNLIDRILSKEGSQPSPTSSAAPGGGAEITAVDSLAYQPSLQPTRQPSHPSPSKVVRQLAHRSSSDHPQSARQQLTRWSPSKSAHQTRRTPEASNGFGRGAATTGGYPNSRSKQRNPTSHLIEGTNAGSNGFSRAGQTKAPHRNETPDQHRLRKHALAQRQREEQEIARRERRQSLSPTKSPSRRQQQHQHNGLEGGRRQPQQQLRQLQHQHRYHDEQTHQQYQPQYQDPYQYSGSVVPDLAQQPLEIGALRQRQRQWELEIEGETHRRREADQRNFTYGTHV